MTKVTRELARGFARWLILVLLVLNAIVWSAAAARCQTPAESHEVHEDREEWEDAVGFATVEVTGFDERLVYYKREFKFRVALGSFGYDAKTQFPGKLRRGKFCAVYCKKHAWLYLLTECDDRGRKD